MSTTLKQGLTLAHFRVEALLGRGGMGEVYRAWDTELDRPVALKILPPDRVFDPERLGRFQREAKSASSLAHPNIVTIYQIGEETVPPQGEKAEPGKVHYIAMELIEGHTLHELIHERGTDLKTLLGWLAQAAHGIARAHDAGVVHRDLKPENVMVTRDGYAKVLDFGLAKLDSFADPDGDPTSAPTATAEGMMMGTVGYMSPEQVHGRGVDHRTDVFAFGCLLYEATTRCKPFVADSSVDVLHQIVHDPPPPIEEIAPGVPGALRRLIKRCLAKDPERRAQSMKDLALELDELVAEFDSLPASASSGIAPSMLSTPSPAGTALRRIGPWLAAIVAVTGLGLGGWWLASRDQPTQVEPAASEGEASGFQTMQIEPLTAEGTIHRTALSPDGRYLAHTRERDGAIGLWIRQIATGSDIEIVAPSELDVRGVTFTPDGDYLYFVREDPERAGFRALYRVPTLGGEPRQIAYDVDAVPTFSPDGSRFAFPRGIPQETRTTILGADADGSNIETLAALDLPGRFTFATPAWSPDGETIVAMTRTADDIFALRPMAIDVATGAMTPFPGGHGFTAIAGIHWLPDGGGLVVVGERHFLDAGNQIWLIEHPSGTLRRISNDLNDYGAPTVSADGETLATVARETVAHLYLLSGDDLGEARQVTRGRREISGSVTAAAGGTAVFLRRHADRLDLWRATPDGEPQRLTSGELVFSPSLSADGLVLLACRIVEGEERPHVWRLDPESGASVEKLTDGPGEVGVAMSPDGRSFYHNEVGANALWRRDLTGGQPTRIAESRGSPRLSPDGSRLAFGSFREIDGEGRPVLTIAAPDGTVIRHLPWELTHFSWHPSGEALVVEREKQGAGNLWTLPLDGSEGRQITRFDDRFILDADWSPDGRWLWVTRGETTSDVVLVRHFR